MVEFIYFSLLLSANLFTSQSRLLPFKREHKNRTENKTYQFFFQFPCLDRLRVRSDNLFYGFYFSENQIDFDFDNVVVADFNYRSANELASERKNQKFTPLLLDSPESWFLWDLLVKLLPTATMFEYKLRSNTVVGQNEVNKKHCARAHALENREKIFSRYFLSRACSLAWSWLQIVARRTKLRDLVPRFSLGFSSTYILRYTKLWHTASLLCDGQRYSLPTP